MLYGHGWRKNGFRGDQVVWGVGWVDVDEVLHSSQGERGRGVDETHAFGIPSAAEEPGAFAGEG